MPDEEDQNLNPGQRHYESDFGFKSSVNFPDKDGGKNVDNNIDEIRKAEENPEWDNKYFNENLPTPVKFSIKSFYKKGPIAAIILTLLFGAGSLISPALIGPSVLANIISKFNTNQEISANHRINKVFSKMLTEEVTTGSCTTVKVYCRFNGISPKMLKKLNANGIKALDSSGKETTETGTIFKKKPKFYSYTSASGEEIKISSSEFFKTINSNAELSSAFRAATNSRFMSLTDSVFKSIKARLGFSESNKLKDVTDEKAIASEIEEAIKDPKAEAAGKVIAEGGEAALSEVEEIAADEAKDNATKITKGGKAGAAQLIVAATCIVTDTPKMIISASRAFYITKLAKYSAYFLSAFGAIKAGDATSEEATAVGNMLTKTVNGKSAMDSSSMKYIMTDDLSLSDKSYKKLVPGEKISESLSSVTNITSSPEKETACAVGMNPATGVAVDVAAAESGVGLPAVLINVAAGYLLSEFLAQVLPPIIEAAVKVIPVEKLATSLFGDITKNLDYVGTGDAIGIGASFIIGQTANAGGNMPLTVTQALAYDDLSNKYEDQIAKEDQATKSPFDTSSKYTFLGNIFSSLSSIYYSSNSSASSILNGLGMIGNTITKSFASMFNPSIVTASDNNATEYSLCTDPSIAGKVAAGPFCNIIYGIPTEYLDKDSNVVINELLDKKQIDENTGDPIPDSDLDRWVSICTDGKAVEAENCVIKDEKTANYALYTIDHRIVEYFNGDNE